ncbi:hypothetical protein C5C18_05975 [Rathayibacter tritici]|nr:hypothetical protein C5C21_11650 [Rathayibacter tritici]PPG08064.1 hypothetical protein C5C18_05975 [Rathayibacter tritici]
MLPSEFWNTSDPRPDVEITLIAFAESLTGPETAPLPASYLYSPSDFLNHTSALLFVRIETRSAFVSTPESVPFWAVPSSP